ncbi:MAG: low-specificity L-threonine aldolase [Acidimicrobiia bacterium]|nr:low-specificity L-threonine aldolase [Acidimicrobiia bacterium]MDH5289042.1 low-specificity L-threonine aldolase [Acidimicrobiia bacterium]
MIDLRSDTVTRPSPAMREAMAAAEVGDDVWGDDPTVCALERAAAELLGKEAAVYVPSGTQSNLCALMAHCQRGDEYIVGDNAHTYRYEAGGGAVLGSIQPQPVRMLDDGRLDLDHVAAVVKPADSHFARSRLLCLENTHDGKILPLEHLAQAAELARSRGLGLHLDGARLWNAAVALRVAPSAVAEVFDTVSVCLSKGLGAPVGSVLVGRADLVDSARRWRKMLGGGMRQAGVIAAGGLYALEHNIGRLADDHANAERLAEGLAKIDGVTVTGQNTNMVFTRFDIDPQPVQEALAANDMLVAVNGQTSRMVTHLDVSAPDIDAVCTVIAGAVG